MSSEPSAREYGRAFWTGFTRPSLGALVIAAGVTALCVAGLCLLVTPELVAGPLRQYFLGHDLDSHARATSIVIGLEAEERPLIVVLGASNTVRLVDEVGLAGAVQERSGTRPGVLHLATDAQNTWEMAALLERVPDGSRVVVVLGLSRGVLAHGIDDGPGDGYSSLRTVLAHPRLGFTSGALDEEARLAGLSPPRRTGIYAIDNLEFLVSRRYRLTKHLLVGPPEYADPLGAEWMELVNDPKLWREEIEALAGVAAQYRRNKDLALAVIHRSAERLRARADPSFVLVEPPVHPGWADTDLGPEFFREYRADLQEFATANGMSFVPITERALLTASDFVDYEGHIGNRAARERCTEVIAVSASELLR